jgi:hypothetical protein
MTCTATQRDELSQLEMTRSTVHSQINHLLCIRDAYKNHRSTETLKTIHQHASSNIFILITELSPRDEARSMRNVVETFFINF